MMIHRQVLLGPNLLAGVLRTSTAAKSGLARASWAATLGPARGAVALRSAASIARPFQARSYSAVPPKTEPKPAASSRPAASKPKVSVAQRAGRLMSFTFYSSLVLGGLGIVGLVVYYFVTEVILPSGDVQLFNKSLKLVQESVDCRAILGNERLKAYGESNENHKMRNRPIASRRTLDSHGQEHLWMRYYVKGELAEGVVKLEMVKYDRAVQAEQQGQEHNLWDRITAFFSKSDFEYRYLVLDVPGQKRVYLINNDSQPKKVKKSLFAGFGK